MFWTNFLKLSFRSCELNEKKRVISINRFDNFINKSCTRLFEGKIEQLVYNMVRLIDYRNKKLKTTNLQFIIIKEQSL